MKIEETYIEINERKLFAMVLVGSLVFWSVRLGYNVWHDQTGMLWLDVLSLALSLVHLIGLIRGINYRWLINCSCLACLPLFALYWVHFGGMNGSASYAYFSILALFLGLLAKKTRLYLVLLLCVINLVLTMDTDSQLLFAVTNYNSSFVALSVNYLLHTIVVAAVVVFIKVKFDKERTEIETHNTNLDQINLELSEKNELLLDQQRQIKSIKNNLEGLVHERTLELENRNQELESYAYDNAHLVRRPLSNMLSLLEILRQEEQMNEEGDLEHILIKAHELDEVVRKINMILR